MKQGACLHKDVPGRARMRRRAHLARGPEVVDPLEIVTPLRVRGGVILPWRASEADANAYVAGPAVHAVAADEVLVAAFAVDLYVLADLANRTGRSAIGIADAA